MISIMMLTIDRFQETKKSLSHNLKELKDYELLVADNGSSDKRVIEYIASLKPKYHRINSSNEGVAHAFNQLFLRSSGDYIVLLGNDITLPVGWFAEAKKYIDHVPNCGIVGFDWGHGQIPPISKKFGAIAHYLTPKFNRVFGVWVLHRRVIENVGLFNQSFIGYGLEDSDMNERVNRAGFNSLYLPNMKSHHLCNDAGKTTEYRKMKDNYLKHNLGVFHSLIAQYDQGESIVAPLPIACNPL